MKRFYLVKEEGDSITEFNSKTPREAALKAASKDETNIILVETNKLHVFRGAKKQLTEKEKNEFTKSKNILCKPVVTHMASTRLEREIDIKKHDDLKYVQEFLHEFL